MIYLDSSVVLARIFTELRRPEPRFWDQLIVSSALLSYEVWNRVNARALPSSLRDETSLVLSGVMLIDLKAEALARALRPFPLSVRTLDALHLATMEFLRQEGRHVELASYDLRLLAAADALGFTTVQP